MGLREALRQAVPLSWLERVDTFYWRRRKEEFVARSAAGTVHDLKIIQDAYARRDQFYKYISENFCRDEQIVYLEFGVHQGYSIGRWVELNTHPDSRFFGFDTFQGLPEDWKSYSAGHFSTQGQMPDIRDPRVRFVAGMFQDTLTATLPQIPSDGRLVVHIDSDLYSSALYVLTRLHDRFVPGSLILFDQWVDIHEYRAFIDYLAAYGPSIQPRVTMNDKYSKVMFEVVEA